MRAMKPAESRRDEFLAAMPSVLIRSVPATPPVARPLRRTAASISRITGAMRS